MNETFSWDSDTANMIFDKKDKEKLSVLFARPEDSKEEEVSMTQQLNPSLEHNFLNYLTQKYVIPKKKEENPTGEVVERNLRYNPLEYKTIAVSNEKDTKLLNQLLESIAQSANTQPAFKVFQLKHLSPTQEQFEAVMKIFNCLVSTP